MSAALYHNISLCRIATMAAGDDGNTDDFWHRLDPIGLLERMVEMPQ